MTTLIQSLTSKPNDRTDDRTGNWNTKVADNKRWKKKKVPVYWIEFVSTLSLDIVPVGA